MSAKVPVGNLPENCHAKVRLILQYWQDAFPGALLPGRQNIDPVQLKSLLGNIWLVDVQRNPLRFRYRVVGTRIVAYLGQDATGQWMDEVIPHFRNTNTAQDLAIVADKGIPRWRRGTPSVRRDLYYKTVEQVSLPLASDGVHVDMIISLTLFLDEDGIAV